MRLQPPATFRPAGLPVLSWPQTPLPPSLPVTRPLGAPPPMLAHSPSNRCEWRMEQYAGALHGHRVVAALNGRDQQRRAGRRQCESAGGSPRRSRVGRLTCTSSMGTACLQRATVPQRDGAQGGKPYATVFRPALVATGSYSGAAPAFPPRIPVLAQSALPTRKHP